MIKVIQTLYTNKGRKADKINSEVKEYDNVYDAYRDAHLTMFHLPDCFEMDLEIMNGKEKKLFATVLGLGGKFIEVNGTN